MKPLSQAPRSVRRRPGGVRRWPGGRHWGCLLLTAGALTGLLRAAEPAEPTVVTDVDVTWSMTPEQRAQAHPVRLEGVVTFADVMWRNLWFESDGKPVYAQLAADPPAFVEGTHFVLEGTFVPNEGLSAARTRLRVVAENVDPPAVSAIGRIHDHTRFDKRRVTIEGVPDVQQFVDAGHLRVMLIVENRPVVCWVRPRDPDNLPDYRGQVVRATGVFSARVDPSGTQSTIEVWVRSDEDVVPVMPVGELPAFGAPQVSLTELGAVPLGEAVVASGVVEARRPGEGILLRDRDGDVWVRSIQEEVFARGAPVEVAGRVVVDRSRRVLDEAIIRRAGPQLAAEIRAELDAAPGRVERVRALSNAQAAEGRRLALSGTVTWSHPGLDFFYLADLTGGTRVRFDPERFPTPSFYKYLRIGARTVAGPAGPEVELLSLEDLGARGHPQPLAITVLDAMAGGAEAQWVEMRGFIQGTVSDGDWRRLRLTSPTGDFVGLLNSPVPFEATAGSLLRIRGVLETRRGAGGTVEEVLMRIPFLHDIHLEEEAPEDPFALPLRNLGSLERLSVLEDMIRVRVRGRLVHQCSERALVLQDEEHGLEVFVPSPVVAEGGDELEVVGILGREGPRVVLRDAAVRRLGAGGPIEPLPVTPSGLIARRWETRLVAVEGLVVSRSAGVGGTQLSLDSDGVVWDAILDRSHGQLAASGVVPGSRVRLVGVGRLSYDQQNRPQEFELELREPGDVTVLKRPTWLNAQRALVIMGGLALVAVLAAGTVLVLRRQVRAQTRMLREQLERQAALEAELERDHRFRAVGALAGGIAHDFNNLLTVIIGNLSLLRIDEQVMGAAGESVEEAARTADRARGLINQLVTLARGGAPVTRRLDVGPWLERQVAAALPLSWRLEVKRADQPLPVQLDEEQMTRVMRTLVGHLADREERSGRLKLKLMPDPTGHQVNIELADDGSTPEEARLESLFDPYGESLYGEERFSMALAFSIVRRHGGNLVASGDRGMVFRIGLPLDDGRRPAAPANPKAKGRKRPSPDAAPGGSGSTTAPTRRVLVLEDEPTVAHVVRRFLERLGHDATITAEGSDCVEHYEKALREGRRYDLVILDLTVPNGMGGVEAVARLQALDEAVCAVASSGYSDDPVMAEPERHGFAAVLRKPYQLSDMRRLLDRLPEEPGT